MNKIYVVNRLKQFLLNVIDSFRLLIPIRNFYNWWRYWLNIKVRLQNARFEKQGSPDGLPLPSPFLAHLVGGNYSLEWFYSNGKDGAECIQTILRKHGLEMKDFSPILDFGCGCGRVMRHWYTLPGPRFIGSDYDPLPIKWCQGHLPFAEFTVNQLSARLSYNDDFFEFIYAISVFTHLPEPLQDFWIRELIRVTKPSGYLYITFLGTTHLNELTQTEREAFNEGRLVVRRGRYPGTGVCLAYHSEHYVRGRMLMEKLTVVDFIPGGAIDAARQDVFLLRKNI